MIQQRYARKTKMIAITLFLTLSGFSVVPVMAKECDRSCLSGMITQYIDALVAHDPSKLPLADNVRFTEDSKLLKPGEGLWKTVTTKGRFRQDYLDTKKPARGRLFVFTICCRQVASIYSFAVSNSPSSTSVSSTSGRSSNSTIAIGALSPER